MIGYGYSGMPTSGMADSAFLDGLVERGHRVFELAFTRGFPWNERRCARFGRAAADRGIGLSVHAPYFAVLTVADEDRAKQCRGALEHTLKLGAELGARIVVAHLGPRRDEDPELLLDRMGEHLGWIGSKVAGLGVSLGLETTGRVSHMGSLGDIALLSAEFPFVRPVVDWAHVHAISRGGLMSAGDFSAVFGFLRDNFPAWKVDPLHTQFSDVLYGDMGEIRHLPYGEGTLRVEPLVRAAREAGMRMTVISESRDMRSHEAICSEIAVALVASAPAASDGRPVASGAVEFPVAPRVRETADGFTLAGYRHRLRLSNLDKEFFPDGYTKGDLISYYASVAPVLLPHLEDRAIVMSRYPDGAEGGSFYEKQAPGHQPDWMPLAPLGSSSKGGAIEYVTAMDAESLMWLANMGCIEVHPWLSRLRHIESEDFAVFDLDPAEGAAWEQVVSVAKLLGVALDRLGLRGYPKTSGSRGIHVYVPLEPRHTYGRVRRFVERVGQLLATANPEGVTMDRHIPNRKGKVFVDSGQNRAGATIASVYSVRPRPGAPVSIPVRWEELGQVTPEDFTIATVWDRISRHGDLFAPVLEGGQVLDHAEKALGIDG
ncbi:MAG: non-homologous end-joining DNA ligase [bacterium]|nr:non-homologous end-joining DNA ligase [bacterium]MDE0287356.1 non-homologous end-joining DNA ligase [bacterium]